MPETAVTPVQATELAGTVSHDTSFLSLFINADPGSILVGPQREFCRSWPNQTEVTVSGTHFVQEDSPNEIGQAVASWLPTR